MVVLFLGGLMRNLILGSGSPRRREILARAGYRFHVVTVDVDETFAPGTEAAEAVALLAARKMDALEKQAVEGVVIAADTLVVCDGTILGKPGSKDEAIQMLTLLSGRTHQVLTGVCIRELPGGRREDFVQETRVTMADIPSWLMEWYVAGGEPMDKAGGYGIQGAGCLLVEEIRGDYENVVGLPVARLSRVLYECFGIRPLAGG